MPGVAGAYVATGHGPWGMLNAPATGLALAELIAGGAAKVVDLRAFDPAALPRLAQRGARRPAAARRGNTVSRNAATSASGGAKVRSGIR